MFDGNYIAVYFFIFVFGGRCVCVGLLVDDGR